MVDSAPDHRFWTDEPPGGTGSSGLPPPPPPPPPGSDFAFCLVTGA